MRRNMVIAGIGLNLFWFGLKWIYQLHIMVTYRGSFKFATISDFGGKDPLIFVHYSVWKLFLFIPERFLLNTSLGIFYCMLCYINTYILDQSLLFLAVLGFPNLKEFRRYSNQKWSNHKLRGEDLMENSKIYLSLLRLTKELWNDDRDILK